MKNSKLTQLQAFAFKAYFQVFEIVTVIYR